MLCLALFRGAVQLGVHGWQSTLVEGFVFDVCDSVEELGFESSNSRANARKVDFQRTYAWRERDCLHMTVGPGVLQ